MRGLFEQDVQEDIVMWKVEIVRVYKSSNLLCEYEDKVIFEVNSLAEASEITSTFDKYAVGEYKYSITRKKENKEGKTFNRI